MPNNQIITAAVSGLFPVLFVLCGMFSVLQVFLVPRLSRRGYYGAVIAAAITMAITAVIVIAMVTHGSNYVTPAVRYRGGVTYAGRGAVFMGSGLCRWRCDYHGGGFARAGGSFHGGGGLCGFTARHDAR